MRGSMMVLGAALCALAAPVAAWAAGGDMSVATFLVKADALKAKGLGALGSPDLKLLTGEVKAVGTAYRTDIEGARKAGRTPHSCPPARDKVKLKADEILAHFRAYPAPARPRTTVKTAFYDLMKKKYPCPA